MQERVYGLEFTTDCLVDRDGRASVILRRRDLVRAGLAAASTTFEDDTVCSLLADMLRAVRAGPWLCLVLEAEPGVYTACLSRRAAVRPSMQGPSPRRARWPLQPVDQVIDQQRDRVEVVTKLKQVVGVKG
ncbi:hypothetical protein [Streptomyces sp. NPDC001816]|uniref:hypothetical protein n=1 Tax=Streptomyces sp. NPDC001816 TaxID=3364612 RepID=UPI0036B14E63